MDAIVGENWLQQLAHALPEGAKHTWGRGVACVQPIDLHTFQLLAALLDAQLVSALARAPVGSDERRVARGDLRRFRGSLAETFSDVWAADSAGGGHAQETPARDGERESDISGLVSLIDRTVVMEPVRGSEIRTPFLAAWWSSKLPGDGRAVFRQLQVGDAELRCLDDLMSSWRPPEEAACERADASDASLVLGLLEIALAVGAARLQELASARQLEPPLIALWSGLLERCAALLASEGCSIPEATGTPEAAAAAVTVYDVVVRDRRDDRASSPRDCWLLPPIVPFGDGRKPALVEPRRGRLLRPRPIDQPWSILVFDLLTAASQAGGETETLRKAWSAFDRIIDDERTGTVSDLTPTRIAREFWEPLHALASRAGDGGSRRAIELQGALDDVFARRGLCFCGMGERPSVSLDSFREAEDGEPASRPAILEVYGERLVSKGLYQGHGRAT